MKIDHEFTIDAASSRVWEVLIDPARVVTCLPGASLDSVEGDAFEGRMAVKLGPMSLTYRGKGTLTAEPEAQRILIAGSGTEQRGAGTAAATITVQLSAAADRTAVSVGIDLDLAGKPAQFGRGILAEVVTRLAGVFAQRLEASLAESPAVEARAATAPAEEADDALDLLGLGRAVIARRLLPIAVGVATIAAITLAVRQLRRSGSRHA